MFFRIQILWGLVFLALVLPIRASEDHGHPASDEPITLLLTLDKVEALVLGQNPHIRAAEKRSQAAGRRPNQRLFPADPMVMLEKVGQSGSPFRAGTATSEMWMVEQDLRFPGKGLADRSVDKAEAGRKNALVDDVRREVLLQAREAYWEFFYRQKAWEIRRDAEKRWATLAQTVKSRELTGQWLTLKALRMQLEVAKATNMFITSGRELRTSVAALNHILSQPHGTRYELDGDPRPPVFDRALKNLIPQALVSNPRLAAMRREVEKMGAMKKAALMEHLPDFKFRVQGMRDPGGAGFSEYGFRVGMSVPLFFPFKQSREAAGASDNHSAAKYDLKGMEDETVHMLEEDYVMAESAWRILVLFESGGLKAQTERAWQSAQVAYRNEQMPLPDYVESYNIYLETLAAYYEARATYGKGLAKLDYQVGTLPDGEMDNADPSRPAKTGKGK